MALFLNQYEKKLAPRIVLGNYIVKKFTISSSAPIYRLPAPPPMKVNYA